MTTINAFGQQMSVAAAIDAVALGKHVDVLRNKIRPMIEQYARRTETRTAAELQLDEAKKAVSLASAKLAEAGARRRTAEITGEAKSLARVNLELQQAQSALTEAESVEVAARQIVETQRTPDDARAQADAELLAAVRAIVDEEHALALASLDKALAEFGTRAVATMQVAHAASGAVAVLRNFLVGL